MQKIRTWMLVGIILLTNLVCSAQSVITAHHYTTDNGLPDNNVRCMQQDDDGFLWLGTLYGLYKFDGYSYKKFLRSKEGNNAMMPTNRVKAIDKLKGGLLRLRFNTNQIICYDTKKEMFVSYADSAQFVKQEKSRQKNHFTDNVGNSVVYDEAGSITYTERKTGRQHTMRVISDRLLRTTKDLKVKVVTDKNGLVWVSTNGDGLYMFNFKTGEERHITAQDSERLIPTDRIVDMILDRNGDVWVSGVWYGLTRLHIDRSRYKVIAVGDAQSSDDEVKVLTRLTDGTLLAANSRGVVGNVNGNGNWNGILPHDVIYNSIGMLPDGSLWATTTKNGIFLKNRFFLDGERTDRAMVDSKGRLWVGSINGMLAVAESVPTGDDSFRRFFLDEENFEVRSIMQDHTGRIWLGTNIGVIAFYPEKLLKDPKAYELFTLKEDGMESVRVTALYEDEKGSIWVGTAVDGVYRSYVEKGALHFENITNRIVANSNIQNITPDGIGNIWISTEAGYACYNIKTGHSRDFMVDGNRLLNYCNANCAVALGGGRMAFGTLDGVLFVDDKSIAPMQRPERITITDMLVNGNGNWNVNGNDNITLAHDENSLVIRFSDMMFNGSEFTRYSYWLEGLETEWNEPTATNSASYQNLKPGRYVFHVAGVQNGEMIAESTMTIVIEEPWWNTWWAYLIYAGILAIGGYLVYSQLRERMRLNRRIRDEKMMTEYKVKFFTNVSHEFRTPLTLIISSIDKMQQQAGISSGLANSVKMLKQNTERLKRLIDQLMEFRKMETGQLQLRLQKTDACVFIYNIWQQFHDMSERRRINYMFEQSAKSLPCWLDRSHMDKMVFNILSNAFKYTPVGGTISVKVHAEEGNLVISVADSGVGVPEEKRDTLFSSGNRSELGSDSIGIGLNLVAELARVHHGTIDYMPNEGGGSIFTIKVPYDKEAYSEEEFVKADQQLLTQEENEEEEERKGFGDSYKPVTVSEPMNDRLVMVVEDDNDIQDMLRTELSQYFKVVIAQDGEEAIEMLEQQLPDLVITDYLMPRKNGMELLQHIRKSQYRSMPVIMLTAIDSDQNKLRGMKMGADAYVTKPFSMQLLVAQCVNLMQQRRYMKLDYAGSNNEDNPDLNTGKLILPEIITEERDRKLIAQMDSYIENHMSDPDLNVDRIAEALGYRRTNFYKKITSLLGCSPKEYVRKRKLARAAEMLQDEKYTIAEVAYKLGFSSPQYLSSVFKAHYGVNPSEYQKGKSSTT